MHTFLNISSFSVLCNFHTRHGDQSKPNIQNTINWPNACIDPATGIGRLAIYSARKHFAISHPDIGQFDSTFGIYCLIAGEIYPNFGREREPGFMGNINQQIEFGLVPLLPNTHSHILPRSFSLQHIFLHIENLEMHTPWPSWHRPIQFPAHHFQCFLSSRRPLSNLFTFLAVVKN